MNRTVISAAVGEALAECEMLRHVTSEHAVSVLREQLRIIRLELRKPLSSSGFCHCTPQDTSGGVES